MIQTTNQYKWSLFHNSYVQKYWRAYKPSTSAEICCQHAAGIWFTKPSVDILVGYDHKAVSWSSYV